jgi:hypothetical protein
MAGPADYEPRLAPRAEIAGMGDSLGGRAKTDPARAADNDRRRGFPNAATGIATLSCQCYRLQRTEKEHKAATGREPARIRDCLMEALL